MTIVLILAVVYLFLANCVHRRRVRHLETLLLIQEALEAQEIDGSGVVVPPSWTYTAN